MGSRSSAPLRSLPRAFLSGVPDETPDSILLPDEEYSKFYKVLRLSSGAEVLLLPGDGRAIRCQLDKHYARTVEVFYPKTESARKLTLCLAQPKNEKLEESVRLATEIGVAAVVVFQSERSVVKWDDKKRDHRLRRLRTISREAAEVSFRTHLPQIPLRDSLVEVLSEFPRAQVLSEVETVQETISLEDDMTLVIGPEGGWSPREVEAIGDRAVTLGPRVLRVDTAVASACAIALMLHR